MNHPRDVEILRIYLGETAHRGGKPLYELIVEEARKKGLAGASVIRGFMGFGANSLLHTAKILRLSEDLPVIVEIVDIPERIADFMPLAQSLMDEGTMVVQPAKAVFHLPLRIRDIMSSEVFTVAPGTPLSQVAQLLIQRRIKALPVMDGQRLVGIITGGDLLKRGKMPLNLDVQRLLPPILRAEHLQGLDSDNLTAKEVMSSPAKVINLKTRVPEALATMAKGKLKRLLVVDDSGNLLGIVSRVDVLRAIAQASSLNATTPDMPEGLGKTAQDVMYRDVPTACPDTPLAEVLEKIVASPLRRVVVVDAQNKVLGIILDRDLVARFVARDNHGLLRSLLLALSPRREMAPTLQGLAKEVMKTEVFTIAPDLPLRDIIGHFVDKQAKRLVVAGDDGALLGMVDRDTVLRALSQG